MILVFLSEGVYIMGVRNDAKIASVVALVERYGVGTVTKVQLNELSNELYGTPHKYVWIERDAELRVSRGVYKIPAWIAYPDSTEYAVGEAVAPAPKVDAPVESSYSNVATVVPFKNNNGEEVYIPEAIPNFVPFGNYDKIKKVMSSGLFYPLYVTGLSGNGKTTTIIEVAAELKRELFRVNLNAETDEDDLLGGFRLVNGETVWEDGPVIRAMERGGVLLLDAIYLATNKVLCLMPVLEGKSIYLKKINRVVKPKAGFTVMATANTKGKGDNAGGFIGTNVMNEAFLDRFPVTMFNDYPPAKTERMILKKTFESLNMDCVRGSDNAGFAKRLVDWANVVRATYLDGAIDEIITTRRLVNIVEAFSIFSDKKEAIALCIERFDTETRDTLLDLYTKMDDTIDDDDSDKKPDDTTTSTAVIDW